VQIGTDHSPPKKNNMKKGLLAVFLILLLPSVLWLSASPIDTHSATGFAFSLGQYFGVLGFTFFTIALMLSMRLPMFERIFGNLAMSYRFHQWCGAIAAVLLILHPLLIAVPVTVYFPNMLFTFFVPYDNLYRAFGVFALITLVIVMIATFFVSLPYHTWKKIHRYMGLAFLLGALHGFFIDGSIAFTPAVRALVGVFGLLGIVAICYRILFKKYLVRKTPFTLERLEMLGTVAKLTLKPVKKSMSFRAGQFAYLTIHDPSIVDEHPFSIVSKEGTGNELVFMAKMLGDDTSKFGSLKNGTKIDVEGPFGNFSYAMGGKRQLWIAGGIGVTPFLSLAASLAPGYTVDLYYSVKTVGEEVGHSLLQETMASYPGLKVHIWITAEKGYLTVDALKQAGLDLKNYDDVLICGPGLMMTALQNDFSKNGIKPGHIHTERFATRTLLPPK
jgi:predicted ferric reductase